MTDNIETKGDVRRRHRKSFLSFITEKVSPIALALILLIVLAFGGAAFGYILWSQRTILNLSQENQALATQNLNSQNNHHANTVKTQAQLTAALNAANASLAEVKESAAVIEYEGGVIAFQNGIIIAAQQQGHNTLAAIQQIQMEVGADEQKLAAALNTGQAEINAYLVYLSCLGKNSGNTAVCGSAPPLPPTSTTGG